MDIKIIVALIGFCSSAFGGLVGILINSKLMNYRIEQLEKKVDKHNNLIERTYKLEQEQAVLKEEMKVEQHRTQDLEEGLEKANDKITNMTRRNGI